MTPAAPPWQDAWWQAGAMRRCIAWRGVEAQHVVATMKLVDTLAEQDLLEQLLEASKPPLPQAAVPRHYLLGTPFRYRSPHASRFRQAGDPGIWYGAEELRTACTEVAYWRWRFLMDSDGLRPGQLVSEHTFFRARVDGLALDLGAPPWSAAAGHWQHPDDYAACHALAHAARERAVQWLRYASARADGGHCTAVLDPAALALHEPQHQQTWVCKVSADEAWMVHAEQRWSMAFGA